MSLVVDTSAWYAAADMADVNKDSSFADRTSFAVMERLGIQRVAAFDDDFAIHRYGRERRRAFTVLR